jgi:hypothetical protein
MAVHLDGPDKARPVVIAMMDPVNDLLVVHADSIDRRLPEGL